MGLVAMYNTFAFPYKKIEKLDELVLGRKEVATNEGNTKWATTNYISRIISCYNFGKA